MCFYRRNRGAGRDHFYVGLSEVPSFNSVPFSKLHVVDLSPRRLQQATGPRKLDVTGTQRAAPHRKNESCPRWRVRGEGVRREGWEGGEIR